VRELGGRGAKTVTVVTGLPLDGADLTALSKRLKSACGTGGTVKSGALEFQGDHRELLGRLTSAVATKPCSSIGTIAGTALRPQDRAALGAHEAR